MLVRSGDRIYCGHDGGMPGYLANVLVDRDSGLGGAVLVNGVERRARRRSRSRSSTRRASGSPPDAEAWRPGTPPPDDLASALGRWWSEGAEFVFRWHDGRLECALGRRRRVGAVDALRACRGRPLPHGLRPRARRAARARARRRRPRHAHVLGDVPVRPRAPGHGRVAAPLLVLQRLEDVQPRRAARREDRGDDPDDDRRDREHDRAGSPAA